MERLKKHVQDWLNEYANLSDKMDAEFKKQYFTDFLTRNSKTLVQQEETFRHYILLKEILDEEPKKEEVKEYIERTIDVFHKRLLTQKLSTTTNRMVNLTLIWQHENLQNLYKQFKSLLSYLN